MKKFNPPTSALRIAVASTHIGKPAVSSPKKLMFTAIVTTLLCLVAVALPNAASAFDAAGDFSFSSNPNGTWSYGWSSALGSAFNLNSSNTTAAFGLSGLSGWLANQGEDASPYILRNTTANPILVPAATTYQPGQLAESPGTHGEYAIVRWTAPSTGQFSIAATFSGLSSVGDSVDVHILLDGTSIFDSGVYGTPSPTSYSGHQNLAKGDTIDFAVGFGSDGSTHDDTTALDASIVAVPEPSALGLVGAGLGCLLSLRFLKRQ